MVWSDPLLEANVRPIRRAEYEALAESGAFRDEKVELVYGRIITMSPQGDLHAFVIRRLNMILAPALVGRADVGVQLPFAASDISLPEPDFAVTAVGHMTHPSQAFLVVEVAVSSLDYDRHTKARLYAEAGVPEYWVIDVPHQRLERFREPRDGRYTVATQHVRDESVALLSFPDVTVRLAEIFPPR
jgi:Uma2 family endonuclease